MNSPTNREARTRESFRIRMWVLILSVSLNVVLLAWWLRPSNAASPSPQAKQTDEITPNQPDAPETSPTTEPSAPTEIETQSPWFRWADVESPDRRQFIANLRAVGCPEEIIRDIICVDMSRSFRDRVREIWEPPPARPYWQKSQNPQPDPSIRIALEALASEQEALLKDLLGYPVHQQEFADTLFLQLHGSERELIYLPPERREVALAALADMDQEARKRQLQRNYSPQSEQQLFEEKLNRLATVLSPEELEEFRLRGSWNAQQLRAELSYFECSPDEFKALLDLRERNGFKQDLLNRTTATEEVRQLWGEERAKEFAKTTDFFYGQARRAAESAGLPIDRAEQAWTLINTARAAADQITKGQAPSEDRQRQIEALRQKTETELNQLLGTLAAQAIRRDLSTVVWSQALQQTGGTP